MFSRVTTNPGAFVVAANAACRLNVLRVGFGLAEHHHQTKPEYVKTHGDHVGGDRAIDSI